jgi:hypothetical protein
MDFVGACGSGFLCAIGLEGLYLKGAVEQKISIGANASCQIGAKTPLFPCGIARGLCMPVVYSLGVLFTLG